MVKFEKLEEIIKELHKENKINEILALIHNLEKEHSQEMLGQHYFNIMFYKAYFYTEIHDYNKCFDAINSLINSGYACPLDWGRFQPLEHYNGYEELIHKNNYLIELANKNSKFQYSVELPIDYNENKAYPVFIVLHGDGSGGNIRQFRQLWKPDILLEKQFIVVYVQSSQFLYHNNYGWINNPDIAYKDISECFKLISNNYSIDRDKVIIGGFSGGSIMSIDIALNNTISVKGFISLCPVIKPKSFNVTNIDFAVKRGIRGVIMEGELELPVSSEEEMIKIFKEKGLQHKFIINKNIGHAFPEDFQNKLNESINFILN